MTEETNRGDDRNDWLESAACRGLTFWHFENTDNIVGLDSALRRCRACPVLAACRACVAGQEQGLPLGDRFGITAAMIPYTRWVLDGAP